MTLARPQASEWDAWFAWLERDRPVRLLELPLADFEDDDGNLYGTETAE